MGSTAACYVDTCLLVSLFLQDEGYPASERWLAGSVGDALHLALASRAALPLVSADQRLVQAAAQLGITARLVI